MLNETIRGFYATRVYLPLSGIARRWQNYSRRLRGKSDGLTHGTGLPQAPWTHCTRQRSIKIWEGGRANGNVRISELGILCAFASECADGSNVFEVGTFDGRTTLNLALNAPARCVVYTLDLPPDRDTAFPLLSGERHLVEKPKPGLRYEAHRDTRPAAVGKIRQLLGDSATFDFSPYEGSCSLVFVDGAHGYDYVLSDSRAAMAMASRGGVVVWHDYGVWPDVTRALDELEQRGGYGLRHIRGTSLVCWRKGP